MLQEFEICSLIYILKRCLTFTLPSHPVAVYRMWRVCLMSDTRVRGWLLLDSYTPTFLLTITYLLSIYLGTKYMKNRPAYSLKNVLLLYNFSITVLSFYMLVEVSESTVCLHVQQQYSCPSVSFKLFLPNTVFHVFGSWYHQSGLQVTVFSVRDCMKLVKQISGWVRKTALYIYI